LKFTKKGFIRLAVVPVNTPTSKRNSDYEDSGLTQNTHIFSKYVQISVEDTGCGISKEQLPRLFQLYGKLPQKDHTLNKYGVGLGLVVSQNLARMMGPSEEKLNGIFVRSEIGKGSEFSFILKTRQGRVDKSTLKTDEFDEKKNEDKFTINTTIVRRLHLNTLGESQRKILVVDDDQMNIMVFKSYLKKIKGFSYETCNDGSEAIETIEKASIDGFSFDIVFMDVNMPKMDGISATKILKQKIIAGLLKNNPIIALTANHSEEDKNILFEAGYSEVLKKPLSCQELETFLRKTFY
jgi:CheY-like chemotaxis protein